MKKSIYLLLMMPLFTFGQFQERQNVYPVKANVITISFTDSADDVMKNLKTLLIDEMYSIDEFDTDFMLIETRYKKLKNASVRLHIRLKLNVIEIRGYTTNNLTVSSGMLSSGPEEFRAELRPSKITVMAIGFEEMIRLAEMYKEKHNGSLIGVRE